MSDLFQITSILLLTSIPGFAQRFTPNPYIFPSTESIIDWRAFENGIPVVSIEGVSLPEKYDYMEGLNEFRINENIILRTLTVARSREGHPSQHIIAQRSTDNGATWMDWFDVEPEGPPITTYGSFVRHLRTGRIFYIYLRGPDEDMYYEKQPTDKYDIATFLGWYRGEPFRCYPHLIGTPVFKYVNDKGEFSDRYNINLPVSEIDNSTIFKGKYFVLYNVPVPRIIQGENSLSWCTKHGPIPRTGNGESFFVLYKNYLNNDHIEELEIELIPATKHGIAHPAFSNAGSFGPIIMGDKYWLFWYRTVYGYIGTATSYDGGLNWDTDVLRYSPEGPPIKNPQGPFCITKDDK